MNTEQRKFRLGEVLLPVLIIAGVAQGFVAMWRESGCRKDLRMQSPIKAECLDIYQADKDATAERAQAYATATAEQIELQKKATAIANPK